MLDFLKEQTEENGQPRRAYLRPPPTAVQELTPNNFRTIVSNEDSFVFVNFYSPGCDFCEALQEPWERLADAFLPEGDSVVIAQLNAQEYREYAVNFDISGFPTLKYFPKGRGVETRASPESWVFCKGRPIFAGAEFSLACAKSSLCSHDLVIINGAFHSIHTLTPQCKRTTGHSLTILRRLLTHSFPLSMIKLGPNVWLVR